MERLHIDYEDIEMESRKRAGLKGVSFVTPEHGAIVTIFENDSNLINAIDNALYEKYHNEEA